MNYERQDVDLSRGTINFKVWNEAIERKKCPICKEKKLIVDVSMALIQCEHCGISFEYRYNRGIIPYKTFVNIEN